MDALKILVVDDESRMRKLVKDFLTKKNFQVLEAGDGEEAMDIFYKEKDIALLILDANFHFLPDTVLNIFTVIKEYGALVLIAVVGCEAMSKRNFIFQIIFLALVALIVIFLFFPGTYDNLIHIIK